MSKRSEIRESAFKLIFESLFRDDSPDEILECAEGIDEILDDDEVKAVFKGVVDHTAEVDKIIGKFSEKRVISRIPKVSLAILRLAFYEIKFCEKVPENVAISEAVLLAKKYAADNDVSFINGVLGAYSRGAEK